MGVSFYGQAFEGLAPFMRCRILTEYTGATPEDIEEGRYWYVRAHHVAIRLGSQYGVSRTTASGVLAALSPRLLWDRNVEIAEQVLAGANEAKCLGGNLRKAIRIRDGAHPLEVLGGNKVRAFFACIENPSDPQCVVIDQHAGRIALATDREGYDEEVLGRLIERFYDEIADGYRVASEAIGLIPSAVQAITWCKIRRERFHGHR